MEYLLIVDILGIILIGLPCLVNTAQEYNPHKFHVFHFNQTVDALDRMVTSMRTYIQTGIVRAQEIKTIRWYYEESAEYETGYLIGDIIERYKKMVEQVRHTYINVNLKHKYMPNDVFHVLMKLEIIQKLYFEIYHLVRMLHEVPKKFKYEMVTQAPDVAELQRVKELEHAKKTAEELRVKRVKKMKAARHSTRPGFTGTTLDDKDINSKPYNIWWPLDYGWELDAYGW